MEALNVCGEKLWFNASYYDAAVIPNFTRCFQHTILVWIPALFFWICAPCLTVQLLLYRRRSRFYPLPWTRLLISKMILTIDALISALLLLITYVVDGPRTPVNLTFPLIRSITMGGFLVAQFACRAVGIVSSGFLFNTALLHLLASIPEACSWIGCLLTANAKGPFESEDEEESSWHGLLFLVWFLAIGGQFALQCRADVRSKVLGKRAEQLNRSAELNSSFLSRVLFWWYNRLPLIGAKRPVEDDDLFDLNRECRSDQLDSLWQSVWRPKAEEFYAKQREAAAENADSTRLFDEKPRAANGSAHKTKKTRAPDEKSGPPKPSVILSLLAIFKWQLVSSGLLRVIADLLNFASPLLFHRLLGFVAEESGRLWEGVGYALLMFLALELRSLLNNNVFFMMFRLSIKVSSILIGATFKKTLRLSNGARKERTVGSIVNIMAVDSERFHMIFHHIHTFWSTPFQIFLALLLLFRTLGWAALPGVFVMLSFIPLSLTASVFQRRWQQRQMHFKDERAKMLSEVLNGIKVIKLAAWERAMQETIESIRKKELNCIRWHQLIRSGVDCFSFGTPFLVAVCSFATYVWMADENALTPQIAFVSLALFNTLRLPMQTITILANLSVQLAVSNERIKGFLLAEEVDEAAVERNGGDSKGAAVEIRGGEFAWDSAAASTQMLRDVNLFVPHGRLIGVVGRVGAGKSSLLSALLGEMHKIRGHVALCGQVGYAPQSAWLLNCSLRENITFGRDFHPALYKRVVEACALEADLEVLPHGDRTQIGEKARGINLSGGQKARISLARAVFQNADVYLLDDPLSAVDAHVARHLFEEVIGPSGVLKNKTRLLVTHNLTFLRQFDSIVHIEDGQIVGMGTFDELLSSPKFSALVAEEERRKNENKEDSGPPASQPKGLSVEEEMEEEAEELESVPFDRRFSTISAFARPTAFVSPLSSDSKNSRSPPPEANLIRAESMAKGGVRWNVYFTYIRAASVLFSTSFVALYITYAALQLSRNLWLSAWSDDNQRRVDEQNATSPIREASTSNGRLETFAAIGFLEILCFGLARLCLTLGGLKASKNLHAPVLSRVLRAPSAFFDSTPLGRVLNRFGHDIDVVDMNITTNFRFFMQCTTQIAATILAISTTTPLFVLVFLVLVALYVYLLKYYVPLWRQLRRMESNGRSPIYSNFTEVIQGVASIRAFGRAADFCRTNDERVDHFARVRYNGVVSKPWFGIRLELLGNAVTLSAALFAALSHQFGFVTSAGLVGFSVTYALTITETLNFAVRQISELEVNLISVERLKEYTTIDTEAEWILPASRPAADWPQLGAVEFRGYSTRYRPGLDLVVKHINARIEPGQRVGIVGRTGAGKSSLTLALFRLIEPAEGAIVIDGVDIANIGLHDLRSRLTIIPQDPCLFSGSLRFNLDPFERHSDHELWQALEMAHLKDFAAGLTDGLSQEITEGGGNLSVGQRQLLCLARALLRRSTILVLDEATASVDLATDVLIQQTIRREFARCTVLTIAHRLHTIADYDLVLVLDGGVVREFDAPARLLADPHSLYASMVANAQEPNGTAD